MQDIGHWLYPGEIDPAEWFGFIYRIVDTTNGREYIGKKQFHSHTSKPPKKGMKRRRRMVKESDWRTYTSSSKHVNDAIEEKGKDKFVFLIESLHENKSSLHYGEVEAQVFEDVLRATLPTGERKYYNAMVANIKFLPKPETSKETGANTKRKTVTIRMNDQHSGYGVLTEEARAEWGKHYRVDDDKNG